MSNRSNLSASLSLRARESARRRRDRELKVESLEPRLALATGLLSTLVSVRDDAGQRLLAPGGTAAITEGQELTALVPLPMSVPRYVAVTGVAAAAVPVSSASTQTLLVACDCGRLAMAVVICTGTRTSPSLTLS